MRKTLLLLAACACVSTTVMAQAPVRLAPSTQNRTTALPTQPFDHAVQSPVAVKADAAPARTDYVTTQPEGELKTYVRDGMSYVSVMGGIVEQTQDGQRLKVVFDNDGKSVWFYEIVGAANSCFGWVKGELNETNDRITVAPGQYAWYYDYGSYQTGYAVSRIKPNPDGTAEGYNVFEKAEGDIVYSYDATTGKIKLLPDENGVAAIGLIRDSTDPFLVENGFNGKWLGYGDVDSEYEPFAENFNVGPDEALPRDTYSMTYSIDMEGNRYGHMVQTVWDGDKVVFPTHQQLGIYNSHYCFFEGGDLGSETDPATGEEYQVLLPEEQVAFDFDATTKTMSATEKVIALSGSPKNLSIAESYIAPVFGRYDDIARKPAKPTINGFEDDINFGMRRLRITIPTTDTEGNFIDANHLSYGILINGEPFTFTPTDYFTMETEMTTVPFGFSDNYFFLQESLNDYAVAIITSQEVNKLGVKSYYEGGNSVTESDLAELIVSGIDEVNATHVKAVVYHDLTGREVINPASGMLIKTTVMSNGTKHSQKVLVK